MPLDRPLGIRPLYVSPRPSCKEKVKVFLLASGKLPFWNAFVAEPFLFTLSFEGAVFLGFSFPCLVSRVPPHAEVTCGSWRVGLGLLQSSNRLRPRQIP